MPQQTSQPNNSSTTPTASALPTQIVNEFCKLQRGSVTAEILWAKGQYEMMQRMLFEMTQVATKINAMIGGNNGSKEEPHNENNPGGDQDPPKQPRSKAKSSRRVNRRKKE